jgi:hypothetical protein
MDCHSHARQITQELPTNTSIARDIFLNRTDITPFQNEEHFPVSRIIFQHLNISQPIFFKDLTLQLQTLSKIGFGVVLLGSKHLRIKGIWSKG